MIFCSNSTLENSMCKIQKPYPDSEYHAHTAVAGKECKNVVEIGKNVRMLLR